MTKDVLEDIWTGDKNLSQWVDADGLIQITQKKKQNKTASICFTFL